MQDEQLRRLSKLNEAARAMTRCHELGELLDTILRLVEEVFRLDTCAVLLLEGAGPELRIVRARGYDPRVIETFRGAVGKGITGRVARDGRPELVADVRSDPDYVGGVEGAVSEMAAPMRLDGEIVGVLDAELRQAGAFGQQDVELFAAFADHAAVAVQNARLHDRLAHRGAELERHVKRLELLGKAARTLSSSLELDVVLDAILQLSHEALRFDQCAVLLFDGHEGELRVRASMGYDQSVRELRIPLGEGVTGEVARTGKPVLVADVEHDRRYIRGVRGGRCEMAAPLVARGETLGVLDAESTVPGAFGEADLELFATFALHAAAALANAETYTQLEAANAKLHRNVLEMERMNRELLEHTRTINDTNAKLEHRVHELVTLQEASRAITSSLDLDETLQAIVRMTREIIRSSMSAIKLLDEESNQMSVRARIADDEPEGTTPSEREVYGVPLRIGDRTIGSFEVMRSDDGTFSDEERRLLETLASQAAIAIENARLFENTQRTYFETIRSLAHALEARDSYTRGHSERVMRFAVRTAEALGVPEEERRIIGHASLLHDIGKIGIADAVLNKTLPLTEEDRRMIENHPIYGDTIIGPLRFLESVQTLVRHHHERFDGSGYPSKLVGNAIPLGARIIAVADSYDAMTSDRPYRVALSHAVALDEIRAGAGRQFDAEVVRAFLQVVERHPPTTARPPASPTPAPHGRPGKGPRDVTG